MTSLILFSLAMVAYTLSQWAIHRGYSEKVDSNSFWGMNAWSRKYKFPNDAPDNWYYKLFNIKYQERFPLSTTLLVFLTDGYHMCQFFFHIFIIASIVTFEQHWPLWQHFVLLYAVRHVIWWALYENLLKKKK